MGSVHLDRNTSEIPGESTTYRSATLAWPFILSICTGYTVLAVVRYFTFNNASFDTAVIGNVLWRIAHGFNDFTALVGAHHFVDHASPLLLVFLPFFRVSIDVGIVSLLVGQGLSLVMIGWAVWSLASFLELPIHLRWTSLLASLASPGSLLITQMGFHATGLALGPLAMTLSKGIQKRPLGEWWWWPVLAAFGRQEIAVAVFIAGLVLFRQNRRSVFRLAAVGLFTLIGGLVWGWFSAGGGSSVGYHLAHLGSSPGQALATVWEEPSALFPPILEASNLVNLAIWLLPFGLLLPLRAWWILLPALPLISIPILGVWPAADSTWEHYWHILLPTAALASVVSVHRLAGQATSLMAVAAMTFLALSWLPAREVIGSFVSVPARQDLASIVEAADLSDEESVSGLFELLPRLAGREELMVFPRPFSCVHDVFGFFAAPSAPPDVVMVPPGFNRFFSSERQYEEMESMLIEAYRPTAELDSAVIWRVADEELAASLYVPCNQSG